MLIAVSFEGISQKHAGIGLSRIIYLSSGTLSQFPNTGRQTVAMMRLCNFDVKKILQTNSDIRGHA
jgi:hypothetical protein